MKNLVMIIAVLTLTSCSKTMDPGDLLDPTGTVIKQILTLQNILLLQLEQDQDSYPIYHKTESKSLVTEMQWYYQRCLRKW